MKIEKHLTVTAIAKAVVQKRIALAKELDKRTANGKTPHAFPTYDKEHIIAVIPKNANFVHFNPDVLDDIAKITKKRENSIMRTLKNSIFDCTA